MRLNCFFDGSCGPTNPGGTAAYGFVIKHAGETIQTGRGVIGKGPGMTNNVAEAQALSELLAVLLMDFAHATEILIQGDSNIMIRQMNGKGKKQPKGHYAPYIAAAHVLAAKLRARCPVVSFAWIPREQNHEADALADFGNGWQWRQADNLDRELAARIEREP